MTSYDRIAAAALRVGTTIERSDRFQRSAVVGGVTGFSAGELSGLAAIT